MPHSTDNIDNPRRISPSNAGETAGRIIDALVKVSSDSDSDNARLVDIASAQVAGISYSNIGDAGLEFLEEWAASGATVTVPAFMNPCAMDTKRWRELGISPEYAAKQERIISALTRMGVQPSLTCAPYYGHFTPERGQHLAWSESSAVSCANSLFGAMTNREGGPSALAAAICGKTVMSGYHLPENRKPTLLVKVGFTPKNSFEFGALGLYVGRLAGDGVPFFMFPEIAARSSLTADVDNLKSMAAGMAASGAVALFHIKDVTPEAGAMEEFLGSLPEIEVGDPSDILEPCGDEPVSIDVVALGCPHASIGEIREIARRIEGKTLRSDFWICASRRIHDIAAAEGLKDIVERAGARLLADMCIVVAPLAELGIRGIATNSAKTAYYLTSRPGVNVRLGGLAECVEAALAGEWRGNQPKRPRPSSEPKQAPSAIAERPAGVMKGRSIVDGRARGTALCSREPIGFFGNIDPKTGVVTEPGHELEGRSVAGKILVFPRAKGSTVGSYVIYSLKKAGRAPLAIINERMEPIVAAGAAIAGIPAVDGIDASAINTGDEIEVSDGEVRIV